MSKLGKKLWDRIEAAEGRAYISDAVLEMPDKKVIVMAQVALAQFKMCVTILREFLREAPDEDD